MKKQKELEFVILMNCNSIFQTKKFADVIIPRGADNLGEIIFLKSVNFVCFRRYFEQLLNLLKVSTVIVIATAISVTLINDVRRDE